MRKISLILLMVLSVVAATSEPSAFGAGDLDSSHPYGLSEEEYHILKNKRAIEALQKSFIKQQQVVQENRERLDGLQSIIEGLSERVRRYDQMMRRIDDINGSVGNLYKRTDQLAQTQLANFEQLRKVLQELSRLIDSINEKYVDKRQFQELEKAFLTFKEAYETFIKKSDLSGKPNAEIFKEAKRLFSKRAYGDAKLYFSHLIKNHYKPATSNYYLGEIAYREGRYKDAIAYYKKSVSIYDKSSFMPRLLLHTAISLERTGEKREAKKFYKSLIQLYPKSKSAMIARKNLKKLK